MLANVPLYPSSWLVCRITKQKETSLLRRQNGKQKAKPYCAFAMYCCHQYSEGIHKAIAKVFGLTHHGSVSGVLSKMRHEVKKRKVIGRTSLKT